jgi:hypothetical protein
MIVAPLLWAGSSVRRCPIAADVQLALHVSPFLLSDFLLERIKRASNTLAAAILTLALDLTLLVLSGGEMREGPAILEVHKDNGGLGFG